MSNLGYIRLKKSCTNMEIGKLYPVQCEYAPGEYSFRDDNRTERYYTIDSKEYFDYLPPDHGHGWIKCIKGSKYLTLGEVHAILPGGYSEPEYWETIPPYEAAADPIFDGCHFKPLAGVSITVDQCDFDAEYTALIREGSESPLLFTERLTLAILDMFLQSPVTHFKGSTLALANDRQERAIKPNGVNW